MGEQALSPKDNMENGLNGDEHESEEEMDEDDDEDMTEEEFEALNNQMDQLNSALDVIEQKNDSIYSELMKLLQENRAIREQLRNGSDGGEAEDQPTQS